MIAEELEEGEIVENEQQQPKADKNDAQQPTVAASPSKKNKPANGNKNNNSVRQAERTNGQVNGQRELEEGELVSSDEEEGDKPSVVPVAGGGSHAHKDKRGAENKENHMNDKKNKKGPKPRWVPLDIEPASVRPKAAHNNKTKSARSPKDVSNNAQDGRRSANKGI